MKKFLILALSLVVAVALTGAGCAKKATEKTAEKSIEKSTGGEADVDLDEEKITIETKEGTFEAGESISLPADFPSDVHVVDGTITASTTNTGGGYAVTVETSKSVSSVKQEYEDELKKDGWEITLTMTLQDGATVAGEKDNRTVTVTISESEGKTFVIIGTSEV